METKIEHPAIRCGFYPSLNHDRMYRADDLARLFREYFTDGVSLKTRTNSLQIIAGENMEIIIRNGFINILGYWMDVPSDIVARLPNADGTYPRIDRVVVRHRGGRGVKDSRSMEFWILSGQPAANPVPPPLCRDGTDFDMCLAEIRVEPGDLEITQAQITDTRPNKDLCGFSGNAAGADIDTTELFAQFTALFEEMTDSEKAEFAGLVKEWTDQTSANQAEFDAFMGQLHDVMGENAATNLLNLVNALRADVDGHTEELGEHAGSLENHLTRLNSLESDVPKTTRTGAVQWFAGRPPSGWLLCNGDSYSTTSYSKLYNAIGRNFTGSSYTNYGFCVPDFSREYGVASYTNVLGLLGYLPTMVAQDYSAASLYSFSGFPAGDAFFTGFSPAHIEAGNLTYDGIHFIKKGIFYRKNSNILATNFDTRRCNLIYSKKNKLCLLWPDFTNTMYYIGSTPEEVLVSPSERDCFTVTPSFPVPSGASGYTFLRFTLGPQSGDIYVLCQTTTTEGKTAYFVNFTSNGFQWSTLSTLYCESTVPPATDSPNYFVISESFTNDSPSSRAAFILLNQWNKAEGSAPVMVLDMRSRGIVNVPIEGAAGHVLNSNAAIGLAVFANSGYIGVWAGHNDNSPPKYFTCSITRMTASGATTPIYQNRMTNDANRLSEESIVEAAPYSPDGRLWFRTSRKQLGSVNVSGSCTWCELEINHYMQSVLKSQYQKIQPRNIFQLDGRIMAAGLNYQGDYGIWAARKELLPYINSN